MGWGQVCRIRHVTSGRYLAVTPDNQVVTLHRNKADEESTAFCLRQSKVRRNSMHLFNYHIRPNKRSHPQITSPPPLLQG